MLDRVRRRYFPKGIRRVARRQLARVFRRTSRKALAHALRGLGIEDGAPVCVHSMLSALGHLVDGPQTVIGAVQDAVPNVTIMMPTFPFGGTCEEYLAGDPFYDRAATRSASGLLTDTLWRTAGAQRSLHPTHSCAALGPDAALLIDGSEHVQTPFGDDSTYGRFAAREDAELLLIHTNNTSLVHRFQEVANTPHLFLEGMRTARGLDATGNETTYEVRVHRPLQPLYVILQGDERDDREHVWLPDYCLPAPTYNKKRIATNLHSRRARDELFARQDEFEKDEVVRKVRYRGAEIIAVGVLPFMNRICNDLRQSYSQFAHEYEELHREAPRSPPSRTRTSVATGKRF